MASKSEFKRRSAAAKRGWATRRKKAKLAKLSKKLIKKKKIILIAKKGIKPKKAISKKVSKKKTKKEKKQKPAKKIKELNEIIKEKNKELNEMNRQLELIKSTRNWVNAMPVEYLKADESIALEPTMLRHMGKVTNMMMKTLKKNFKLGNAQFDRAVNEIANVMNVPLREVYTLWFSP